MIKITINEGEPLELVAEYIRETLARDGVRELIELSDEGQAIIDFSLQPQTNAIHLVDNTRIALLDNKLDAEAISVEIRRLNEIIRRHFQILRPRIACVQVDHNSNIREDEALAEAIKTVVAEKKWVYGPILEEDLKDPSAYDVLLYTQPTERSKYGVKMLPNTNPLRLVVALNEEVDEGEIEPENLLLKAIYTATDVLKMRHNYDTSRENPLPKLYKDRPDAGERLRFNIPAQKNA